MTRKKSWFFKLFTVFAALSIMAWGVLLSPVQSAKASRSNQGTNTDGEWSLAQTTANLITIHEGSLTEQGWNINGEIKGTAVWYKDADLKNEEYGWGIQAAAISDDIGNADYENGVWYRITLSQSDRIKAQKGDLTVSAYSLNYEQGIWNHYCSLKLFFDNAAGEQIGFTQQAMKIDGSAYMLSITDYKVPEDTASIRYYVSNWGGGTAKPFIGGLQCYLTDKTAPKVSSVALVGADGGAAPSYTVPGGRFCYLLDFDEKVSVAQSGTATISLNGGRYESSGASVIQTEDGKTQIRYSFTLPSTGNMYEDGAVTLVSVSGLDAYDEAGNSLDVGSVTTAVGEVPALTFYGLKDVIDSMLGGLRFSGKSVAVYGQEYTAVLSAETGYTLPNTIEVFVGGKQLSWGQYSYDDNSGNISVAAEYVTDYIVIRAEGVPKQYNITFEQAGGTGGSTISTATFDKTVPAITIPVRTGYTFGGYYTQSGGEGTKYYDENGIGTIKYTLDGPVTLYAMWTVNSYTVVYDGNRPLGASSSVVGSTAASSHTYDRESVLTKNGYSLQGWTFKGWNDNAGGTGKTYSDGQKAVNLTDKDGGVVTLYAMWEANGYTVVYDGNKPLGASSSVVGSTAASSHTYDRESVLTKNGYSLQGWTFKGWNDNAGGTGKTYSDGQKAVNLTDKDSGVVTLYAMWEANGYTVTLNAAGGSNSGSVEATFDSTMKDLAALPSRHGYNFVGYFDAEQGGEQYYDSDGKAFGGKKFTVDDNIVLYAQWTPVTYTIEFYSEGRYAGVISEVTFGTLRLPSALSLGLERYNFDFVGWNMYDQQNWAMYLAETDYSIGLSGEQGGTVVLYAAWQEKPLHSLMFDANGGTGAPALIQVHEEETIALPFVMPERADYTFLGWATAATAESAEYFSGGDFTMGDAPVTLYAVWKHNYRLMYDAGEGGFTSDIAAVYPAPGEKIALTDVKPVRTGYVFVGWAAEKDASAAGYEPGGEFEMPLEDGDVTLYAVWKAAEYSVTVYEADGYETEGLLENYEYMATAAFTVKGYLPKVYINGEQASLQDGKYTFIVLGDTVVTITDGSKLALVYDANGGTGVSVDTNEYQSGDTTKISEQKPSRTGYAFVGWAAEEGASEAQYAAGGEIQFGEADIVLYAVWRANVYYVAYDAGDGAGSMAESEHIYDAQSALSKNVFTKAGYYFVGWATRQGGAVVYGDGAEIINLTSENNQTITLYAVWEKTVSSVLLDAQGGTGGGSFAVEFGALPESSALTAPARAGYRFSGYYTQADGGGIPVFDADMTFLPENWNINERSVTLFAGWTPITYSIIYVNGGDEAGAPQTVKYGETFNLITASQLGIQTPENMSFLGWATYPGSAAAVYTDGQPIEHGLSQTEGARIYLYAVFAEKPKWNVTYDANGGNGVPVDDNAYYEGEKVFFGPDIPQRYGYIFLGWSYSPRDDEAQFAYDDGKFTAESFAMPYGGVTLYAVWQEGDTLQAQIQRLENALSGLESAVNELQNASQSHAESILLLTQKLEEAQAAIDAMDDTYATIESVAAMDERLSGMINAAKEELNTAVCAVQSNLDAAVEELSRLINQKADSAELARQIEAVSQAYSQADEVIKSEYIAADAALKDQLTDAISAAVGKAEETLTGQLNAAKEQLNAAIAAKADADTVSSRLDELKQAYESADAAIRSDFAAADDALREELSALMKKSMDDLRSLLEEQLAASQTALQQAIDKKADASALETAIAQLTNAYELADAALRAEISDELTVSLTSKIDETAQNLQIAFEEQLNATKDELQAAIETKADADTVAEKVAAVEEAFAAADAVLRAEISDELTTSLTAAIDNAVDGVRTNLTNLLEDVQSNLDAAVKNLNAAIDDKADTDTLEQCIADLTQKYETANVLLNTEITNLQAQDDAIGQRLDALEAAYKAADEAIIEGLQKLQAALDDLRQDMQNQDASLEEYLNRLASDGNIAALTYLIVDILLACAVVALAGVLVFRAVKKRRAGK